MKLSFYALSQTLFDGSASRITAKTAVGELTILDNHIPLLVPLVSGLLRIEPKSTEPAKGDIHAETIFSIKRGFLEVRSRGEVVILANVAQSE